MYQRFARNRKTVVAVIILGTTGLFCKIVWTSIYRSVETRYRSETHGNFRTVTDKLQSAVNNKYILGFTENQRPFVRIYDSVPPKETNVEKMKRFEGMQKWIKANVQTTKPDVKPQCSNSKKVILWYDVYHDGHGVRNKARKVDFSKCDCPCELDFFVFNATQNVTYEPFGADAVLIQINKLLTLKYPPLKRAGQVFVAVEREATPRTKIPLQNFEYVFNWTMTFRQDSDIFYPYGRIVDRVGTPPTKDYSAIYKKKKKPIVWFVSHCRTKIGREEYAEELRKYIDIDIVGKCGSDICFRHDAKECFPKFEEGYFFLFNYENTRHTDYVTEKLYDNYHKDMVQIVCGAADYDKLVPDKTVVNVNKFESPKALATYLKTLMESEELYTSYLKKKGNYYSERLNEQSQKAYCELCTMLHDADRYRNLYKSIGDWFVS